MTAAYALLAGAFFGLGLVWSGMTQPANVRAFLDLGGHWSPSLAYTMAAAIAVALPAYAVVRRRGRSLRGDRVTLPRRPIDRRLVGGSALFGVGWGLSGICPGPGLILLLTGDQRALVFIGALFIGSLLADRLWSLVDRAPPVAGSS